MMWLILWETGRLLEAKEARKGLKIELNLSVPKVPAEFGSLQTHLNSLRSVSGKTMLVPAPRVPQEILRPPATQILRRQRRYKNFILRIIFRSHAKSTCCHDTQDVN